MSLSQFYTRYQPVLDFLIEGDPASSKSLKIVDESGGQAAVDRLAASEDFQILASQLMAANPFAAMGRLTDEVRHSNFLAYLLTPWQTHGYGTDVLFGLCPAFRGTASTPPSDPKDIIVLREHVGDEFAVVFDQAIASRDRPGRPDLIVYDPILRRLAIIELKIGSAEGPAQRRRYRQWATEFFAKYYSEGPSWQCNFVFLAKDADAATTVAEGMMNARPFEIATGGSFESDIHEDSVWTMAHYGHVTQVLSSVIDQSPPRAGDQLVKDYLAFLGEHVCPSQGLFSPIVQNLVAEHQTALDAVRQERRKLRQEVITALQPAFEDLGLQITEMNNGHFTGNPYNAVSLSYVRSDDGDLVGWGADATELTWQFSVFVKGSGTALCAELEKADVTRRGTWSERFRYKAQRESAGKRVLTIKLPMPIQQKPYPLTRANLPFLVEHLRMRLRTKAKLHIDQARLG
ncbi:PD-(D/E)XK nuclease family protein [Sphingobium sp. Ndbn-10]|uniref:PD-(D/E)XK nuclease family protein n=1 Tax=Sphingobium sp. Ndbn-10 TaxID=1667223 RepID=UPI00081892D4|nr:PD-(D/E)XK nuclease family protein [Sphingobium sp. Ndbn-10]